MSVILSPVSSILDALRDGKAVVLLDDEDRENEGDLVVASDAVTSEHIAFMLNHARGLICVSIQKSVAERLSLLPQAPVNTSPYSTAFLTPVDAKQFSLNGATASARAATIRLLAKGSSKPHDFVRPGNIFPLLAHEAGVFGRRGQTEGSADLARLAGFSASGVICELLSERGEVLRGETLASYARRHGLLCTTVEAVRRHRTQYDVLVRRLSQHAVINSYGSWEAIVFRDDAEGKEHVALVFKGDQAVTKIPLVRIHSECITGDFLGSLRCDCGSQLHDALAHISKHGSGVLIYLRQEGRGIGLIKKLEAYNLQDAGLDTVDANVLLGLEVDSRSYIVAARILESLEITIIKLITNNPKKLEALRQQNISVVEHVPSISKVNPFNKQYLETKRDRMGHIL